MKGKALGVGNNNYRDGHDNIKWGNKDVLRDTRDSENKKEQQKDIQEQET